MGRALLNIDPDTLLDLQEMGLTQKEAASELGISPLTLSKRMGDLQKKQGLLLQYRSLQALQLTELQARVLEAVTPEKIEEASMKDLILAFKILKDKELVIDGKPSEIKGLISYLIEMEKEEAAVEKPIPVDFKENDVEINNLDITDPDYIPNLS